MGSGGQPTTWSSPQRGRAQRAQRPGAGDETGDGDVGEGKAGEPVDVVGDPGRGYGRVEGAGRHGAQEQATGGDITTGGAGMGGCGLDRGSGDYEGEGSRGAATLAPDVATVSRALPATARSPAERAVVSCPGGDERGRTRRLSVPSHEGLIDKPGAIDGQGDGGTPPAVMEGGLRLGERRDGVRRLVGGSVDIHSDATGHRILIARSVAVTRLLPTPLQGDDEGANPVRQRGIGGVDRPGIAACAGTDAPV